MSGNVVIYCDGFVVDDSICEPIEGTCLLDDDGETVFVSDNESASGKGGKSKSSKGGKSS